MKTILFFESKITRDRRLTNENKGVQSIDNGKIQQAKYKKYIKGKERGKSNSSETKTSVISHFKITYLAQDERVEY